MLPDPKRPTLIRNINGAMDEFCSFSHARDGDEIRVLYSVGKPQPHSLVQARNGTPPTAP
jgi:hypothetical protein